MVSILPKVRAHLDAHGMVMSDKLHIVPNGTDPAEWLRVLPALLALTAKPLATLNRRGQFTVGYAGTHGVSNALDTLLGAATLMRNGPVAFVLVGGGSDKARLQQRAEQESLHSVHFFDGGRITAASSAPLHGVLSLGLCLTRPVPFGYLMFRAAAILFGHAVPRPEWNKFDLT